MLKKVTRSIVLGLFIMAFCASPLLASEGTTTPDPEQLTIEQAILMSHTCNTEILESELNVDKAQYSYDQAASSMVFIADNIEVTGTPMVSNGFLGYKQASISLQMAKKVQEATVSDIEKQVIVAYSTCLKADDSVKLLQNTLDDLEAQIKLYKTATAVGYMAEFDYETALRSEEQLKEQLNAAIGAKDASFAALRKILNKGPNWTPELVSLPSLDTFPRRDVQIEISRGVDESVLVLQAKATYDIENAKTEFPAVRITDTTEYFYQINKILYGLDYEQAKRSAVQTVESLYYQIDALEANISKLESALAKYKADMEMMELKYEVGVIPERALAAGSPSLASARLTLLNAELSLADARNDLIQAKANYSYLTGLTIYSSSDWNQ